MHPKRGSILANYVVQYTVRMLRRLALAAGVALAAQGATDGSITVSAAVSLTEVMEEIGGAYTSGTKAHVVFNFGASNALARQIANGAPVDVFISADAAQMAVVEKAGLVATGTQVPLLGNRLAIVHHERRQPLESPASLTAPGIRRIAIGDPEAVPAGAYAKQYLERVGLWQTLQPRLLPMRSVRAALAAVEHGAADAGIVYVTDARVSKVVRVGTIVSGPDAPTIVYPACVVESSRRKGPAAAFLKFVQTPDASRIFEQHGFQPLAAVR